MAAKYSRILRSIWRDPDFITLPAGAQRLYVLLFSQPDISACGVLPLLVARWANLAPDTDADSVQSDMDSLTAGPKPLVVTDDGTLEAWVRGYLKIDELYKVPNGRKSIDAALEAVVSPLLRDHIGRVYETLVRTHDGTLDWMWRRPQQPAASSLHRLPPLEPQPQPDPARDPSDKFGAVIDCMVGQRLQTERNVRNPTRYRAALKRELPAEHADTVYRLLEQFPAAPVSAIASAALTGETRNLAGWA